ncbi:hypothetical protein Cantr_01245 [Candida viswanathii]|uniref:Protein RCR2 n=1 Tax=Candida viswanathii TaxID=5486 RepID=A0A367YIE3_9ASCO|nr:hypothetical protein Cantr_01245 [Candida viswanathii]
MIVPASEEPMALAKRLYYYGDRSRSDWWKWRWLLWLLVLIPFLVVLFLFFFRRRNRSKVRSYYNQGNGQYQSGYYANNDLPPQSAPGYVPPSYPETSQPGYGGYSAQREGSYGGDNAQPQQESGTYDEFSRPAGPPPAHTKS